MECERDARRATADAPLAIIIDAVFRGFVNTSWASRCFIHIGLDLYEGEIAEPWHPQFVPRRRRRRASLKVHAGDRRPLGTSSGA